MAELRCATCKTVIPDPQRIVRRNDRIFCSEACARTPPAAPTKK